VIDNASNDGSSDIAAKHQNVKLLKNATRLGFASNNNLALKQSRGRYVLLLNPDTILEKNTLPVMVDYMDKNPEIGAASCKLVNPDGSIQFNARMFPTPTAVVLRWAGYERLFPRSKVLNRYLMSEWDHETERDVDWILGAFLLVRREVIEQVGFLDESFDPLYYEDIDWCFRIREGGWRIRYVPYVKVVHLYDRESASSFFNRMTFIHLKNILRYFWKHRGKKR
jgi:N-acetylglucosaminyl-diphospho-decaprenol L-rhamnosyltransferase